MVRIIGVPLLLALTAAACSSATSGTVARLDPVDLVDMDVDMFAVVADIPHRQYLGESNPIAGSNVARVYRWKAEYSLIDRDVAGNEIWLSAQFLQSAGLPVLDEGTALDFTEGLYRDTRYRLGGTLNRISIGGLYDVRLTVIWRLYDTQTGDFVFEGSSNGFARGKDLGRTGSQSNALLDSFRDCLGHLVADPAFAAAIGAPVGDGS